MPLVLHIAAKITDGLQLRLITPTKPQISHFLYTHLTATITGACKIALNI